MESPPKTMTSFCYLTWSTNHQATPDINSGNTSSIQDFPLFIRHNTLLLGKEDLARSISRDINRKNPCARLGKLPTVHRIVQLHEGFWRWTT
ncbi:hypothetical protein TNCV_1164231 [Trichonephila clavipes]|nr:hypothetical protein TNCV_1164231 [Trichonephila clavipes]